jgi:hypothetical protein
LHKNNILVKNISDKGKFSNIFIFKFFNKKDNSIINDLKIKINDQKFLSNNQGEVDYIADYDKEIIILLDYELTNPFPNHYFIIYQNDSFSPLNNKNISLKINAKNTTLENLIKKNFEEKGFKFSNSPDISLVITDSYTTNLQGTNQYITELNLTVTFFFNNKTINKINILQNSKIIGYGTTKEKSLNSALQMEYYPDKEKDFLLLQDIIQKTFLK